MAYVDYSDDVFSTNQIDLGINTDDLDIFPQPKKSTIKKKSQVVELEKPAPTAFTLSISTETLYIILIIMLCICVAMQFILLSKVDSVYQLVAARQVLSV